MIIIVLIILGLFLLVSTAEKVYNFYLDKKSQSTEKYIKIPSRNYKVSELLELDKEETDSDSEIDRIYRDAGFKKNPNKDGLEELSCVISWMRIPLIDFEGCSYDSASSRENMDEEFENGEFKSSIIFFKNGFNLPCLWSIDKLEKVLINYGIVDPKIRDQKEIL